MHLLQTPAQSLPTLPALLPSAELNIHPLGHLGLIQSSMRETSSAACFKLEKSLFP
jgi:hypothetical protein